MQYLSTRGEGAAVSFSEALLAGLAPDGGLYVPAAWPRLEPRDFNAATTLSQVARTLIAPFVAGDTLEGALEAITADAFDFPAPLVAVPGAGYSVLELFHGPTAAFKDFGARFLAASMARLRAPGARPLEILVATSGDTGGAVAAAFHRRPGIRVAVLYPKGLVSPAQEQQLTCWGDNVQAFAVRGSFDDCQQLVKAAFVDTALRARFDLSSANSINLGRLLPQAAYHAATALAIWRAEGRAASFVIPSGNLGNALACIWARHVGLPIGEIVLAHNANRTVPDFLAGERWQPRRSIATLASAMDVGDPSNMERLRALFPEFATLKAAVSAEVVDDSAIRRRIAGDFAAHGMIWCPHTACAAEVMARMPAARRTQSPWVIAATAHPAKFREIVEPLIGRPVPIPQSLARLYERPSASVPLEPRLDALRDAL
ncbi:MAG: Threonine synthase [Steroidobacteraceae bacterium]|nr:Threonine synthase [Steroidobacteraceae bacterium]